ncbi:MAG TPA: hypothetical protein VIL08_06520, partial [Limnochorda sp.]
MDGELLALQKARWDLVSRDGKKAQAEEEPGRGRGQKVEIGPSLLPEPLQGPMGQDGPEPAAFPPAPNSQGPEKGVRMV